MVLFTSTSERGLRMNRVEQLHAQVEKIVAELQRLGYWDRNPEDLGETFIGQLRFSMIPGIEARLRGEHPMPSSSNLGLFAIRELEGQDQFRQLVQLLIGFDEIFKS